MHIIYIYYLYCTIQHFFLILAIKFFFLFVFYFCICLNTLGKSISRAVLSIPPTSIVGVDTGPALTFGVYFSGEFSLDSSKSIIIYIN